MRKRAAVLCLTYLLFIAVHAQTMTAKYQAISPHTQGFYEYLPQGYNPSGSQTYPVLISFHGAGNIGNGSVSQLPRVLEAGVPKLINEGGFPNSFTVNGQTHRMIVIAPQFSSWPDASAVRLSIDLIIGYVIQNYKVNTQRIYLTGLSMGGGFCFDYAGSNNTRAMRIAAMVPIAEAALPVYQQARTIASANLPVWATHNTGDPNVPVLQTSQYIDWINEAPAPNPIARKSIFGNNIHDAWTQTYNPSYTENGLNIYQWMLQFQRVTTALPPVVDSTAFSIAPNPVIGNTTIQWKGTQRGKFVLNIYNSTGGLVKQEDHQKQSETWQHNLQLQGLPAGTYWIELTGNKYKYGSKLMKR